MNILINKKEKYIVAVVPRCGSNYIKKIASYVGLKDITDLDLPKKIEDYKIIKIVRDPIERFNSWFYNFVSYPGKKNYEITWNKLETTKFFKKHIYNMNFDNHIKLQSLLYNKNTNLNQNVSYLLMENINAFFGIGNSQHTPAVPDFLKFEDIDYFNFCVNKCYKPDIKWFNSLNTDTPPAMSFLKKTIDMGGITDPVPFTADFGSF